MPKTIEDVDSLFVRLKLLEESKRKMDEAKKTFKEQEDEINEVLKKFAEEQFALDPSYKHVLLV
jgi:hypothetical protein